MSCELLVVSNNAPALRCRVVGGIRCKCERPGLYHNIQPRRQRQLTTGWSVSSAAKVRYQVK